MYDSLSSPHETMPILIGRGSPVQTPSGESQVPHTDSKRKKKMFKTQLTYCCDLCKLLLLDVLLLEVKKIDARTGFFVPGCTLAVLQLGGMSLPA
jgi:hypothetical protein